MKYLILTFLFAASFQSFLHASTDCREKNRNEFLKLNNSLYEEYSKIDSKQIVTDDKKGFWIQGDPKLTKRFFLLMDT